MTTVLVFGGTFDPVHLGHLAIASQARTATGADAVWFVPAALAPLREPPVAAPQQRLGLLVAATNGEPGVEVLDVAIRRGGVSYTADIMDALHGEHPDVDLAVLIGADVARTINAWHRAQDLLRSERFVIVNRAGAPRLDAGELSRLGYAGSRTALLTVDSPNISASEVRSRCAKGLSLEGLVPTRVAALIAEMGLYRSAQDDA